MDVAVGGIPLTRDRDEFLLHCRRPELREVEKAGMDGVLGVMNRVGDVI